MSDDCRCVAETISVIVPGCVIANQSDLAAVMSDLPTCLPEHTMIFFESSSRNFSWYGNGVNLSTALQNVVGLLIIARSALSLSSGVGS